MKNTTMTNEQIREIFLANGFTIKEGLTDLKPYVYAAARALLDAAPVQVMEIESIPIQVDFESTAGQYRTDIIKALHKAGAPIAHPETHEFMNAVKQIEWLAHRIAELEKDAQRYRALRDRRHSAMPMVSGPYNPDTCYTPEGLDAAIDAILKQTNGA
jgi:hypothetical protein